MRNSGKWENIAEVFLPWPPCVESLTTLLLYNPLFLNAGIDIQLARHVAHLFIRDPVSLFSEKIHQDDKNDSDHFEVRFAQH